MDLQLPSTLSFASCDKETGSATGIYLPLIGGIYAQDPGNIGIPGSSTSTVHAWSSLIVGLRRHAADVRADAQTIIDSIKISK